MSVLSRLLDRSMFGLSEVQFGFFYAGGSAMLTSLMMLPDL